LKNSQKNKSDLKKIRKQVENKKAQIILKKLESIFFEKNFF